MGVWARTKPLRKIVALRASDSYQRFERRVNRSVKVPEGGFGNGLTVREFESANRAVALTFDDGPDPLVTPSILDLLSEHGAKATFFVIGANAEAHPQLMARIADEGHDIGNHTWTHRRTTRVLSTSTLRSEIEPTDRIIRETSGAAPVGFRPPFGAVAASTKGWLIHEFGYPTLLWSIDTRDWTDSSSASIASKAVEGATSGSIVLLHDVYQRTVEATELILESLGSDGYEFGTVSSFVRDQR